jgi:hypothetical protein
MLHGVGPETTLPGLAVLDVKYEKAGTPPEMAGDA